MDRREFLRSSAGVIGAAGAFSLVGTASLNTKPKDVGGVALFGTSLAVSNELLDNAEYLKTAKSMLERDLAITLFNNGMAMLEKPTWHVRRAGDVDIYDDSDYAYFSTKDIPTSTVATIGIKVRAIRVF